MDRQRSAPVADLEQMRASAREAATLLRALANPHRLLMVCLLAEGALSVGELNRRIDLAQSALSQHLAILRREGVVATRRQGQTIYYSLMPGVAARIVEQLYDAFCNTGDETR